MKKIKIINLVPILLLLFACNLPKEELSTVESVPPTPTSQIAIPEVISFDSESHVAYVNGEGISEEIYLAEKHQFDKALESGEIQIEAGQAVKDIILEDLINRYILSQAARDAGFIADASFINERIETLGTTLGGEEALTTWTQENGYTEESFEDALGLEIEAAWQRSQVFDLVPREAEQVLARQLFFYSFTQAQSAYALLENGNSFDVVAEEYDPENLGDLDWFPRNYLLLPEIENLAFSLQLGEYSEIIETDFGYHILELVDYDPAKILSADILLSLQEKALFSWLEGQRTQSQIEFVNP